MPRFLARLICRRYGHRPLPTKVSVEIAEGLVILVRQDLDPVAVLGDVCGRCGAPRKDAP